MVGDDGAAVTSEPGREPGTQALDRALGVLLSFRDGSERKAADVGRELGLHKSTTGRLLRALADAGLLQRNEESGGYRLGVTVLELGARFLQGLDLHSVARPLVHELTEATGESVNLSIHDDRDAISVYVAQGRLRPQLVSRTGRRIPLWCSAAGKALLTGLDDAAIRRRLGFTEFAASTRNTITGIDAFLAEMHTVRGRGWALNDEESEEGLRVVAAPVLDRHGVVAAAISVSGPIFRLDDARVAEIAGQVLRTAAELSRQLGYGVGGVIDG